MDKGDKINYLTQLRDNPMFAIVIEELQAATLADLVRTNMFQSRKREKLYWQHKALGDVKAAVFNSVKNQELLKHKREK